MDLKGFLREVAKVDVNDPANRRWGWVAAYLGECLGIPRADWSRKIRAVVFAETEDHEAGMIQLAGVE